MLSLTEKMMVHMTEDERRSFENFEVKLLSGCFPQKPVPCHQIPPGQEPMDVLTPKIVAITKQKEEEGTKTIKKGPVNIQGQPVPSAVSNQIIQQEKKISERADELVWRHHVFLVNLKKGGLAEVKKILKQCAEGIVSAMGPPECSPNAKLVRCQGEYRAKKPIISALVCITTEEKSLAETDVAPPQHVIERRKKREEKRHRKEAAEDNKHWAELHTNGEVDATSKAQYDLRLEEVRHRAKEIQQMERWEAKRLLDYNIMTTPENSADFFSSGSFDDSDASEAEDAVSGTILFEGAAPAEPEDGWVVTTRGLEKRGNVRHDISAQAQNGLQGGHPTFLPSVHYNVHPLKPSTKLYFAPVQNMMPFKEIKVKDQRSHPSAASSIGLLWPSKPLVPSGGKSMTRIRPDAPPCALPTIHLTTIPRLIPETPPDDHFARNNVPGRSLHFQGPIYAPCTEEGSQPLVSLLPTLPPLQRGMRSMLSDICRYHKRKKVMKKPRGADEEKEVKSIPPYIQTIASM